jgi:SulP family sulfate permease
MCSPQRYRPARLPGSHIFRDIRRYPDAQCIPGLAIFRFDASLCFANIHIFLEALRLVMSDMERKCAAGLSCVVIEFGSINDVDASALRMLQDLHKELRERRVRLLFSSCKVSASERLGSPLMTKPLMTKPWSASEPVGARRS